MARDRGRAECTRRSVLRVEALEGRCLPSVVMSASGSTLYLVGDEAANDVQIVRTADGVQATGDGDRRFFAGIDAVEVQTGGGNDTITLDNHGGLPRIQLNGGEGADRLHIIGGDTHELFEFFGAREPEVPGVQFRVTDLTLGVGTSHGSIIGTEDVSVAAGADDEYAVDNHDGAVSDAFLRFRFEAVFTTKIDWSGPGDEGPEESITFVYGKLGIVKVVLGSQSDGIDIGPGPAGHGVEISVNDAATGIPLARISGTGLESVTIKGGDGADVFRVQPGLTAGLFLFGQGGADEFFSSIVRPRNVQDTRRLVGHFDGGDGDDRFDLLGSPAGESVRIDGVADQALPDPHMLVTDLDTRNVTGDLTIVEVESIGVDTAAGDDRVEMGGDARYLAGIRWTVATGRGDDEFDALLAVPSNTTGDALEPVRTVRVDLSTGSGDDRVAFNHRAGSFFNVFFTADLGAGNDTFSAVMLPSASPNTPGPEGARVLRFEIDAGAGNDLVGASNLTDGRFFDVFLDADLGAGDDTWQAVGLMRPRVVPGSGFDTARVSLDLLPFTGAFEDVEIVE